MQQRAVSLLDVVQNFLTNYQYTESHNANRRSLTETQWNLLLAFMHRSVHEIHHVHNWKINSCDHLKRRRESICWSPASSPHYSKYFNTSKTTMTAPRLTLYCMGEAWMHLHQYPEQDQDSPLSPLLFNTILEVLARANGLDKEIKGYNLKRKRANDLVCRCACKGDKSPLTSNRTHQDIKSTIINSICTETVRQPRNRC